MISRGTMKDDFSKEERNVAIKRIPKDKDDKDGKIRGFAEREVKHLLMLLPHENVIQYLAAVSQLKI